jgi:hypothetical protein
MPLGPRGPEMTPKLLALDGRRVRILGYMAQQKESRPGVFMLNPVPLNTDEASDATADDLLQATLFVHLPPAQANLVASYRTGLLLLTGTLGVGHREESDGHLSLVRLQLDASSDKQAQISR